MNSDRQLIIDEISAKLLALTDAEFDRVKADIGMSLGELPAAGVPDSPMLPVGGVVDTDVLTGPTPDLKSFLIKKQRASDAK